MVAGCAVLCCDTSGALGVASALGLRSTKGTKWTSSSSELEFKHGNGDLRSIGDMNSHASFEGVAV